MWLYYARTVCTFRAVLDRLERVEVMNGINGLEHLLESTGRVG
jgi:hypothetical protein